MSFSRSKLFVTAALTALTLAAPATAGSNDSGAINDDSYGRGSTTGRMMDDEMRDRMRERMRDRMEERMDDRIDDRIRERMRERMRDWMMSERDCPYWMMERRFNRPWMRGEGRGMMGGGYGHRGWMMHRFGMGPGMMYGYGGDEEDENGLNLTVDQVKTYLNRMIRNPNLKVGDVKEKDTDTIVAEIVTKQGDVLVQRLNFNKHSGFVGPEREPQETTGQGENGLKDQGGGKSQRAPNQR